MILVDAAVHYEHGKVIKYDFKRGPRWNRFTRQIIVCLNE
jgi:hypothetical protein